MIEGGGFGRPFFRPNVFPWSRRLRDESRALSLGWMVEYLLLARDSSGTKNRRRRDRREENVRYKNQDQRSAFIDEGVQLVDGGIGSILLKEKNSSHQGSRDTVNVGVAWLLNQFFGIGAALLDFAIGAAGLFAASIAVTLAVAGLVWGRLDYSGHGNELQRALKSARARARLEPRSICRVRVLSEYPAH
jgi:hypothetical protein